MFLAIASELPVSAGEPMDAYTADITSSNSLFDETVILVPSKDCDSVVGVRAMLLMDVTV